MPYGNSGNAPPAYTILSQPPRKMGIMEFDKFLKAYLTMWCWVILAGAAIIALMVIIAKVIWKLIF